MKYFKDIDNKVWAFDDDIEDINTLPNTPIDLVSITEDEAKTLSNPVRPLNEQDFTLAVQNFLDTTAQKTKWDNMQSARSAAGIPLLGNESEVEVAMHTDAVKLAQWYLKVWAYCYTQLDLIKAGERSVPESAEAFIEELPPLGANDVVA